jgi:NADPH:quinone reductase
VGPGVTVVQVGRVAYAAGPPGSYSQSRLMPAHLLVLIPEGVSDQTAAAVMLKGMTAQYPICRTYPVQAGETVVFYAAAGGVGLIACQGLKALGATVIGVVSSGEKAEIALAHGCEHVIVSTREEIAERLREITGGAGVPVV